MDKRKAKARFNTMRRRGMIESAGLVGFIHKHKTKRKSSQDFLREKILPALDGKVIQWGLEDSNYYTVFTLTPEIISYLDTPDRSHKAGPGRPRGPEMVSVSYDLPPETVRKIKALADIQALKLYEVIVGAIDSAFLDAKGASSR
jgi:succinate dehydrogenase flavin-adding protein (antitoxin of CptAB toxin-antitoxin module)